MGITHNTHAMEAGVVTGKGADQITLKIRLRRDLAVLMHDIDGRDAINMAVK